MKIELPKIRLKNEDIKNALLNKDKNKASLYLSQFQVFKDLLEEGKTSIIPKILFGNEPIFNNNCFCYIDGVPTYESEESCLIINN